VVQATYNSVGVQRLVGNNDGETVASWKWL